VDDKDTVLGLVAIVRRLEQGDRITVRDVQDATGLARHSAGQRWKQLPQCVQGLKKVTGARNAKAWVIDEATPTDADWRVMALTFAKTALRPLAGSPVGGALVAMAQGLESRLDRGTRDRIRDIAPLFHVVPAGAAAHDRSAVVASLTEAWLRSQRCRIQYVKSTGELRTRDLEPLGLLLRGDHLLLVARVPEEKNRPRKHIRVDRIRDVHVTGPHFARPDTRVFDPKTHLKHAWGVTLLGGEDPVEVRAVLRGHWAVLTEHFNLHPSQTWKPLPSDREDGKDVRRAEVTWHVAVCPELINFLLSTMPQLESVEPERVRDALVARAEQGLARIEGAHTERTSRIADDRET